MCVCVLFPYIANPYTNKYILIFWTHKHVYICVHKSSISVHIYKFSLAAQLLTVGNSSAALFICI